MVTNPTTHWWALLSLIAVCNVLLWASAGRTLYRQRGLLDTDAFMSRRMQFFLCAGYVFGCAYRSWLPVFDVPRIVIVDSWLSSVIVGRSVATVAEMCFAAQWALLARELARATGDRQAARLGRLLVPAIATAEVCSWYSVLTTANIGHVLEETIWGACALGLAVTFYRLRTRCDTALRARLAWWSAAGAVYAGYMFLVDVPMYWSRWLSDEAAGRPYYGVFDGAIDAATRWVVSHDWHVWSSEVFWMSAYFSAAVWLSIALVHTPLPRMARAALPHGR